MKVHFLKSWPECFNALEAGTKTYDLRFDDGRKYDSGDAIVFQEYIPRNDPAYKYTGRKLVRAISRVDKLKELPGVDFAAGMGNINTWVILSLRRVDEADFLALVKEGAP